MVALKRDEACHAWRTKMQTISTDAVLLVISQIAGIFLLACTMLLIGLRRIYFDAETKQPIAIELPLFGKITTQAPAFALIVVGAFLVFYPMARPHPDIVTLQGSVDTEGKSVTVLVVAVPQYQQTLDGPGHFSMPVQLIKDASYRVKFLVDKQVVADVEPTLDRNGFGLKPFHWSPPPVSQIVAITPQKEVSDEELKRLGIH
jgi:hypothetical protein